MRSGPLLLLAVGLAATSCSSPQEPHGSPVLLSVYWITAGQKEQIWTVSDTDTVVAPAAGQEIDFVFDRLLDGSRIEDTVTQNGVETTMPKATPPVTVSWPDEATAMSTPPFSDSVLYNSEPFYGAATAYLLLRPTTAGFPSSDTVTFALDKTGLTSAYGDQMLGPSQISVTTAPFSASFRLPSGADGAATVPSSYMLPVVFSNRAGATGALEPFVHVAANGVLLPVALAPDANDPTVVYLSPASCLGGWPIGVPIEVTMAAGAPDAFGVAMAADATTTFVGSGPAPTAPDGGCPAAASDGGTD
ncbi:MAG TPA: hypothetical protein VH853_22140 [Polyangia bacterium]|jgi:hypothetical protein|nr:hypothetical protein [Polyangia bacterium]